MYLRMSWGTGSTAYASTFSDSLGAHTASSCLPRGMWEQEDKTLPKHTECLLGNGILE